jgi:hypothetical protein
MREACDYMTGAGKKRELRDHWQRVAKLILTREDVLTVSRALELTLFYDASWTCRKSRQNENHSNQLVFPTDARSWWGNPGRRLHWPGLCRPQ